MNKRKEKEKKPSEAKEELPRAGPHAKPELTNPEKTPGSGVLPDDNEDGNVQPTG